MFELAAVFRRARRCQRGVAGIEFALLSPILVTLLLGVIDLGSATYIKREAQAAAQAGVQFSLIAGWKPTEIEAAVVGSSTLEAPIITVEKVFACAQATSLSFVSQGSSCGSGSAGTYVRVTVDPQYTPILPMAGLDVGPAVAIVRIE